jgi:hypothetical protein
MERCVPVRATLDYSDDLGHIGNRLKSFPPGETKNEQQRSNVERLGSNGGAHQCER